MKETCTSTCLVWGQKMRRVLHVGCGYEVLPDIFDDAVVTRLDLNPDCNPDIVASVLDLGDIGPFDAVYGSHMLEHLSESEVRTALGEFKRVLAPGGAVIMIVPNLDGILPTTDVVYESPAGPITGLDMIYGKRSFVDSIPFMQHKTGFIADSMQKVLGEFFDQVEARALTKWNLIGVGVKKGD